MDQHSFLFQAIIFLAAAVIFVPIATKLGLGSVLGYLHCRHCHRAICVWDL